MTRHNSYSSEAQEKNLAWFLPRPNLNGVKGSMPLYAEQWCLQAARDIIGNQDAEILNLFCGGNREGFRVDIRPDVRPDLVCDAHDVSKYLNRQFDIIFADPPYSDTEAREIYGTPKLRYKVWTAEAQKLLRPGGLLIVYHKYLMPNPNPTMYEVVKRIFIANRVYHVPRVAVYFKLRHEPVVFQRKGKKAE